MSGISKYYFVAWIRKWQKLRLGKISFILFGNSHRIYFVTLSHWILCHSVHLDADSNSPQEEYEFSWCKNIHDGDDRSTIIMVVMIMTIIMIMMMIFKVVTTMTKDINSRWWPRSGHENEKDNDNENENYSNDEIHRWLRSDPTNCICTGKTFDRWKKFLKWNFPAIFHGNFFIWIYNNLCNEFNAIFCWDIFF